MLEIVLHETRAALVVRRQRRCWISRISGRIFGWDNGYIEVQMMDAGSGTAPAPLSGHLNQLGDNGRKESTERFDKRRLVKSEDSADSLRGKGPSRGALCSADSSILLLS